MEDTNSTLEGLGKIFKILSSGLKVMAEKANELVGSIMDKEENKEKTIKKEDAAKPTVDLVQETQEEKTKEEKLPTEISPEPKAPKAVKETAPKPEKQLKKKEKADKKVSKRKEPEKPEETKRPENAKTPQKDTPAITKADTVLEIINNSTEALSVATLEEKTGFGHRSVLDVVHKLKKQGKIKSVDRGVYGKV